MGPFPFFRAAGCFARELRRSESPRLPVLDVDAVVDTDASETPEPPCRVLLENDDVTPIEYVPGLLHRVFGLGRMRCLWITLRAHVAGVALVVVEPRDEAEAHVAEAHEIARADGHLRFRMRVEPMES